VPKAVVRPTTDRTREALFSIIHSLLPDSRCLDLFGGSGSLGLEALSRGAASCTFVDADRACVKVIQGNLKDLKLSGGEVIHSDVMRYVQHLAGKTFDVVFADPPYCKSPGDRDFVAELLAADQLREALADDGYFVAEAPAGNVTPAPEGWTLVDQRKYGSCGVMVYRKDS